jgi:uncharacterized protein (DUF2062 family)
LQELLRAALVCETPPGQLMALLLRGVNRRAVHLVRPRRSTASFGSASSPARSARRAREELHACNLA